MTILVSILVSIPVSIRMIIRVLAALAAASVLTQAAQAETPLERGAYLVTSIAGCGNCHTPKTPGAKALSGDLVEKGDMMTAYAPNITPDKKTGIGAWSDAQIIAAIREGKHPDGHTLGPPMPFGLYRKISDSDVAAIVAYLRTVPAVSNETPPSEYTFPLPAAYGPPVKNVPDVPRGATAQYGAYLAGPVGHCIECHTPLVKGERDFEHQLGVGGQAWHGPWGISVAANITSHPTDGLGKYSDAEIKTMITKGMRPDGSEMYPPMGYHYYARIKPDDLDAIVAYLRTIPPKETP